MRVDGTVVWTAPNGATVTTEPVDHLRARESRVSALPPVTAAQIDQLREDEELLDLYDAVREARRTEPQRRAEAEAAAEAEFIARGSRAHLDAADAHAAAIVADAGDGSGAEVAAAEGVAAEIRAAARLRPPPAPEELRRAFRARRAEELRRQREVRRGIRPRRPSRHDDAYLDHGSLDHVGPHRQSLDHQSDLEEGGWQDRDWCFEPAQRLRVSAVHYRPHRRYRRAMRRQRRRQRRREANGGPPF